jgi:hypothetical protein
MKSQFIFISINNCKGQKTKAVSSASDDFQLTIDGISNVALIKGVSDSNVK